MKFINKKMVVTINKLSIELAGGEGFSGTNNMLGNSSLGFVERIKDNNVYGKEEFPSIYHIAAAYLFYILKNHPFIDGNKRTALATAVTFLQWNDILFTPFDTESVSDRIGDFVQSDQPSTILLPEIADWLEGMSLH